MGARVKSFSSINLANKDFPDPTKYQTPKVDTYKTKSPMVRFGSEPKLAPLKTGVLTPGPQRYTIKSMIWD